MIRALPRDALVGEPLEVARRLVGQRLLRRVDDVLLAGRIVEVEAYGGRDDSTSHAFRGPSGRAAGMFGPVGRAYVYLIYGMYHCLNVVAHPPHGVGAVLIRALAPEQGLERMHELRGPVKPRLLCAGPGRLCRALAIDLGLDGIDLCDACSPLLLAPGDSIPDRDVVYGPRVGVGGRPEDISRPWRIWLSGDPHVSRPSKSPGH